MAPGAVAAGGRWNDHPEPNGKVKVELGGQTEVLQPPDDKDVDRQLIVDLRRMLTSAGLQPS